MNCWRTGSTGASRIDSWSKPGCCCADVWTSLHYLKGSFRTEAAYEVAMRFMWFSRNLCHRLGLSCCATFESQFLSTSWRIRESL